MKKRLYSILLTLCMLLCFVPTTVFAEGETEDAPACICEMACTEGTINADCPICGAEGALVEKCGKYTEPAENEAVLQPEGEKNEEQPEGGEIKEQPEGEEPGERSEGGESEEQPEGEEPEGQPEGEMEETPACICEIACTEETINADCPICGAEGALVENCGKYTEPEENEAGTQPEDEEAEVLLAPLNAEGQFGIALNAAGIAIDNTNFPDANFCSFVKINFDRDRDGYLNPGEILSVSEINCQKNNIRNLTGIEYFRVLKNLNCSENQLTSLDVSMNTALTTLNCQKNQLTSLNVSQNTMLDNLHCSDNQLTSLDISRNTKLTWLNCHNNQLTSLDISKNTALQWLNCFNNKLTTLDISKNTALQWLNCSENQLNTLDVSKNTSLLRIICINNGLTSLDVSQNTLLTWLDFSDNQLTSIDISQNTSLERLYCYNNQLTSLDVSQHMALIELKCNKNQLRSLDVSQNTSLRVLECNDNTHQIVVDESRNFDLSGLTGGFVVSKASNWNGGTVNGTTLTVENDKNTVTYTYNCGYGKSANFTLAVSYTVNFNTDGGSTVVAQTVPHGGVAGKPVDPVRNGYTFVNWYTDAGCTMEYNFNTPVTNTVTLYAKWTVNQDNNTGKSENNKNDIGNTQDSGTPGTNPSTSPSINLNTGSDTDLTPDRTDYTFADLDKAILAPMPETEVAPKNDAGLKHFLIKEETRNADENIENSYGNDRDKRYLEKVSAKELKKADTETAKPKDDIESPQTGATGKFAWWIILLLICVGVAVNRMAAHRKKKIEEK
jgi:uncharacterized repeat protein (TIGR02543 family)